VKKIIPYGFNTGICVAIAVVILTSCSTTRSLDPGEYLLIQNKILFSGKNPGIKTDELLTIARPRTNQKFLGLSRVKLYFYHLGTKGKPESKFRAWLRDKAGERPSLFDSAVSIQSANEMELYLNKTGFFYSDVSFIARHIRKKKVKVDYLVSPSVPYRINELNYDIDDTLVLQFIMNSKSEPKINRGSIYNAFLMDDERDRITGILQNNGYYYFNRDYIYFEVDSTIGDHKMNTSIKLKSSLETSITEPWKTVSRPHKRYFIRDVYIRPDFDPSMPAAEFQSDTIRFDYFSKNHEDLPGDYFILQLKSDNIHPRTVLQSVFIKPGDPFRLNDISKTRSRVAELGVFSYSNVRFKPIVMNDSARTGLLDCNIDLSKRKLHSFTVETEVTNSGGRPGIGLNFTYSNSNIFRGSETLRLKARGALEAQKIFGDDAEYDAKYPFFNTIETGLEASIIFPRFLIPIRQERFPKYFRPKTTTSLGVGYENRPEYERWLTNLSFGYDWKESERKRHQIFPFDWSVINIKVSPEFEQQLEEEPNDRIKYQYTDNLITAIKYAFTYNTQDIRKIQNFFYFKGNFETAGNLLNAGSNLFNANTDSIGQYILFGIPFAQYIKIDGDFRFFNVITRNNSVAYRFFLGTGIPYGNASVLPLEKGFYGGGANGMRGWPYRLLGPGSYENPDDYFDRMGDIQLEANLELRFPVYNFIKSALFADIGNIWLINDDGSYPGGEFKFNRFYKEFAIDIGLGLRFDFNFFIMRVDFAIPLRDPSYPEGERWVMDKWQFNDFIINFGIGYPF
jgi:outer membrane protein assembly factor BamA